jgi:predicted dienelactone hydrolase
MKLFLLLVALALAACASPAPTRHAAGEAERSAQSASAGLRSGRGDATLRMLVWYPAEGSERAVTIGAPNQPLFVAGHVAAGAPWADLPPRPLIVLSHGFGGVARQLTWLGSALARAGYVVAAVDHPGTEGRDGITPAGAYAPWERAGDVKLVLDSLLADPQLGPHIDRGRIGVAGFSLGGWTAALLAGARTDFARLRRFCTGAARDSICDPQREFPLDFVRQQAATLADARLAPLAAGEHANWRDTRIRAAFLVAPALGQALDAASLRAVRIPLAVLAGAADTVTATATNGKVIADAVPGATLTVLPDVGHYDFLALCTPAARAVAPHYCEEHPRAPRAATHAATIDAALRFFEQALRQPRLQSRSTGLPAWERAQPGQVGNQAALSVATSAGVGLVTPPPVRQPHPTRR